MSTEVSTGWASPGRVASFIATELEHAEHTIARMVSWSYDISRDEMTPVFGTTRFPILRDRDGELLEDDKFSSPGKAAKAGYKDGLIPIEEFIQYRIDYVAPKIAELRAQGRLP
jgi:hypothetical protein